MLTSETRRRLLTGGVFGLPMALVWVTGRMVGGPGTAEAGETPQLAVVALNLDDIAAAPPTPAQLAAAKYIDALASEEFGPTPLHHRRPDDAAPVVIDDPEDAPVPEFTVTLIMTASTGNRALIDGKVYTVGQELAGTGWTIIDIDARRRLVSIRDPKTERIRTGTVD